jgi:Zn-finger nucleic acid-binding protein
LPGLVNALRRNGRLTQGHVDARLQRTAVGPTSTSIPTSDPTPPRAHVDLDTGLVLHCPSCAASVKRDSTRCAYCGAQLDFSLNGKTVHCFHCYQRTPADGRFCVVCGRPLQTNSVMGEVLEERLCPRCAKGLRTASVGDFPVMACDTCSGLFITHETFDVMQEKSQRTLLSLAVNDGPKRALEKTFSYARCPVCKTWMNRKNFAGISGVIVDTCGYHGIWFDLGEMERIMDFIARGGLEKAKVKEFESRMRDAAVEASIRKDQSRASLPGYSFGTERIGDSSALDIVELVGEFFDIFRK